MAFVSVHFTIVDSVIQTYTLVMLPRFDSIGADSIGALGIFAPVLFGLASFNASIF